jgi:metal-sulfur cluster biosynthetic enzyme
MTERPAAALRRAVLLLPHGTPAILHEAILFAELSSDTTGAVMNNDLEPRAVPTADGASGESDAAAAQVAGAASDAAGGARDPQAAPPAPAVVSEDEVKLALRRVKDPELNLNVIDLGLIYAINVDGGLVSVDMSLTSPGCPSGPEIMRDVEEQLRAMPGVEDVIVNLVWSPYWTPERIEPRVRAYLGF